MKNLRYVVPNAITATGILFGALSIRASLAGTWRAAAWWIMACLLTDKLDGAIARGLRATSAFGVQLDSFADFLSFGLAPAALLDGFFSSTLSAGWAFGWRRSAVAVFAFAYLLGVACRLARFNATATANADKRHFLGLPTPLTGAGLAVFFLTLLKYGDPSWSRVEPLARADDWFLLGDVRLDLGMRLLPWLPLLLAPALVSNFRVPKLGPSGRLVLDGIQLVGAVSGLVMSVLHRVPEYMAIGGFVYFLSCFPYHLATRRRLASVDHPDPERAASRSRAS